MNKSISITIILGALIGAAQLTAAEKWEGTDQFDNSKRWFRYVDRGNLGKIINSDGRLIFNSLQEGEWNSAAWVWGNSKKGISVPTGRSWEVGCEITFPENSPTPNLSEAGATVGVAWSSAKKGRAVYCGVYGSYDGMSRFADSIQAFSDYNFEQRLGTDGGSPDETEQFATARRTFLLLFRHNALTQKDLFELRESQASPPIYQRLGNSELYLSPWVQFFLSIKADRYKSWPSLNNNIAVDNWYLLAFDPGPINLNSKTSTSRGVNYSVAVTALGMTGAKLTGTVALTVGTVSATLPITGSIDKNGYFALTAKGTGANKGFGCVLLYDVATGTYRPNKNTVTAPKQKAIKF